MMSAPLEDLRGMLRYEEDTGLLFWLPRSVNMFSSGVNGAKHQAAGWNTKYAGKEASAGTITQFGYRKIAFRGKQLQVHRVIWFLHYGSWPVGQIDHINGNRLDNRICNLRDVTPTDNQRNKKKSKANTSGIVGVRRADKKWRAQIKVAGRYVNLGTFSKKEDAAAARKNAERQYGFHPNHGRAA